jgi:hypothetical protein
MITQQFPNVTPDRWQDIKQVIQSDLHFAIESDEGSTESHGVTLSWLFAAPVLTATVDCPHFGMILKLAGFHCEQDVMSALAKKIEARQ